MSANGARIFRIAVEAFTDFYAWVYLVLSDDVITLLDAGSSYHGSIRDLLQGFEIIRSQFGVAVSPADIDTILVTHGHIDHNEVKLVARKPGTVILAPKGAVSERGARQISEGGTFDAGPVKVRALPAANRNHSRDECVGYLLSFDDIVLYHSGDTNWLPEMETWSAYRIDWALLCCDGFYNMPPAEASRCAAAMKAAHVVPIHSSKSGLFDEKNARAVTAPSLVVLRPGEKTPLKH